MSVDEELIPTAVPIASSFDRIAEQGIRKAVEGSNLSFEALTADVQYDALTSGRRAIVSLSERKVDALYRYNLGLLVGVLG